MPTINDYHERILEVIRALVELDPAPDSLEGRLLLTLTKATEEYERELFPIAEPTPAEAAEFRAEQERLPE